MPGKCLGQFVLMGEFKVCDLRPEVLGTPCRPAFHDGALAMVKIGPIPLGMHARSGYRLTGHLLLP